MPQTEVVQDFVEKLGNFYEMVDERNDKTDPNSKHAMIVESDQSFEGDRTIPKSQCKKVSDCSLLVEDQNNKLRKSENTEHINGFVQGVKWPKYCQTNVDISLSEPLFIESSKVMNDNKSSENAKVGQNDECQDSGNTSDDVEDEGNGEDEDAANAEEEDTENEEDDDDNDDSSENEDGVIKESIVNHSVISDDTFDEDEFCDTIDIPFHQVIVVTHERWTRVLSVQSRTDDRL